jgi:pullulanase/glycogen debranching enzyme
MKRFINLFVMKPHFFLSLLSCLAFFQSTAQILEVNPAFPNVNDVVTITYDATQGNAALVGQTQIYCHAGLITSASTSPTNWQFVQGNWGTVDPEVAMTNIGNNKHTITIDIDQFYGFPVGTNVLKFAFVFRTANGSIVGRAADGSDIYYDMYPVNAGLLASFFHPTSSTILDINEQLSIEAAANQSSTLTLKEDGIVIQTLSAATQLTYNLIATTAGTHLLEFIADNGSTQVIDSAYYTVNPQVLIQDAPYTNLQNGINYINDTTVVLQLYAPQKEHIYVIGDFNAWSPTANYHMNLSTNNATWWLEISGLMPGQKYGYQYLIDGNMRFADPLSPLILDPNNDNNIGALTNPTPHPYPTGLTTGFVTVMQPGAQPYNWSVPNIAAPEKKDLVIYELLVRDFVAKRNYQTLIDTLEYLSKLGINAIELMPPGEFENNESWGYNPSFHMALDKYYGTPEKFKEFVDSCHARGIAVIVDMVLNHAFGQNPMVKMYWDAANNRPAANNPWFNAICPHEPYCWGYDFDHTRLATQAYIDRVNRYWVETYNIDGFRFDYTKGFVNNANAYSIERINILKRMADEIWTYKPNAYVILEHWCDNSEEEQLADHGMMLWGNTTHGYQEALMGFPTTSNISSGIYTNRGWTVPHLVSYAESHDEERTMFKALTFGNNTNAAHNARDLYTALGRAQALAVTFLTQPGPRMLWQFQELGYDISIDNPCRVCNKPILWNYYTQARRRQLYDVYAATLALRNNYETFRSLSFQYSLTGAVKRVNMNHSSMNGVSLSNFATTAQSGSANFQHGGWWYEYFTGDSVNVTNTLMTFNLNPGEYRIYTDVKLAKPVITDAPVSVEELEVSAFDLNIYPNPSQEKVHVLFSSLNIDPYELLLLNSAGAVVFQKRGLSTLGTNDIDCEINELPAGEYHVLIKLGQTYANKEFVKID